MPPMTTVASGRCTSAPVPVAIAMGTKPSEATKAVISTGALPGSINEPGALAFSPSGELFVVVPHEEAIVQLAF